MKKAIFLDRDGTLNKDVGYLKDFENFFPLAGTVEALRIFQNSGYSLFIVTNQSGVARGYFSEQQVQKLNSQIQDFFRNQDITILETVYCPHLPGGKISEYAVNCLCRKPAPGMLKYLEDKYTIDTKLSYMVGDKISDANAGREAGAAGILLESGLPILETDRKKYPVFASLRDFAESLERDGKSAAEGGTASGQ